MKMKSKNNWTMRAAVLMFALVLITSSFVGGTFAKYVTEGSGGAQARVAKFGVTINADSNSMFKTSYSTDDTTVKTSITESVVSDPTQANPDSLVAPGTFENDAMTFSITGKPEVAVKVEFDVDGHDVYLKAGEYNDVTTAKTTDKFTLADDYYPVVFTLKQNGAVVKTGKIEDIENYFTSKSTNYKANTNLSTELGVYTLSWKWEFAGTNDKADTLLGNLAALDYTTTGLTNADLFTKYNTGIAFSIKATVTQID